MAVGKGSQAFLDAGTEALEDKPSGPAGGVLARARPGSLSPVMLSPAEFDEILRETAPLGELVVASWTPQTFAARDFSLSANG